MRPGQVYFPSEQRREMQEKVNKMGAADWAYLRMKRTVSLSHRQGAEQREEQEDIDHVEAGLVVGGK